MPKLIYYIAATLDGFIAGPQGQFDFFPMEGDAAAALLREYPETIPAHGRGPLGLTDTPNRRFDTVLMGRGTYAPALDAGITSPYPHLRQYVFSTTLADPDPNVRVVSGDAARLVADLKQRDGMDLWLCGGGALAAQLYDEIDELVIKHYPITIGTGVPLFDRPFAPTGLELVSARTFSDSGMVLTTHRRS